MDARIAVDAMGGDVGPPVTVAAALRALDLYSHFSIILVGDADALQRELSRHGVRENRRMAVRHASQRVEMNEAPSHALRNKKDSSMRVALDLVKDRVAQACVSAGNTGALMATARFVLKTLPGIDRPAICGALPGMYGHSHVLDLGANVDSSAEDLFQFAVMGAVLTSAVENRERPSVALLNIGEEKIKGNETVKRAAQLLAASPLNYAGFIEGDGIFRGEVDVIVCDGFAGNIALKSAEGVAKMLMHFAREEFTRTAFTRLAGIVSRPVLRGLRRKADPRRYNGASLLGLRGIVVKSHGGADELSFLSAVEEAALEVEKRVPERIAGEVAALLKERRAV